MSTRQLKGACSQPYIVLPIFMARLTSYHFTLLCHVVPRSSICLYTREYNIQCRRFADDIHLFVSLKAVNSFQTVSCLSECAAAVKQW